MGCKKWKSWRKERKNLKQIIQDHTRVPFPIPSNRKSADNSCLSVFKQQITGTGKAAQELTALAILTEDPGLTPSTWWLLSPSFGL